MLGKPPRLAAVDRGGLQHVGEVLLQVAAVHHVQELHPAADRKHRQVAVERGLHQRELRIVAVAVEADGLGVRRLAIQRGIDIGAAREDDPVERIEHLLDALHRRDHHRQPPGAQHRPRVGARRHHVCTSRQFPNDAGTS